MRRFTSTHTNKVDGKGRVSVPAPFRAVLEAQGGSVLYLTPNKGDGAIDGFGEAYMADLEQRINALPIGSPKRRAAERRYFANTTTITYDPDGRFVLPQKLIQFAGLTDQATFIGLGQYFQIWKPDAYAAVLEAAAEEEDLALELPPPPARGVAS